MPAGGHKGEASASVALAPHDGGFVRLHDDAAKEPLRATESTSVSESHTLPLLTGPNHVERTK